MVNDYKQILQKIPANVLSRSFVQGPRPMLNLEDLTEVTLGLMAEDKKRKKSLQLHRTLTLKDIKKQLDSKVLDAFNKERRSSTLKQQMKVAESHDFLRKPKYARFKQMKEDQPGLPLPGFDSEGQEFVLSYFDVYDEVMRSEVEKFANNQSILVKKFRSQSQLSPAAQLRQQSKARVEAIRRRLVRASDDPGHKTLSTSAFLKLKSGATSLTRGRYQQELLRGNYQVEFPPESSSTDQKDKSDVQKWKERINWKLAKIAQEPLCFQLYKRGDLLKRTDDTLKDWGDLFSKKYLYSIISEEKALKVQREIALVKKAERELQNPKVSHGVRTYLDNQKQVKQLHRQFAVLEKEREVLEYYTLAMRTPNFSVVEAFAKQNRTSKEDRRRALEIEAQFGRIRNEYSQMSRYELNQTIHSLIQSNLRIQKIDADIERLKKFPTVFNDSWNMKRDSIFSTAAPDNKANMTEAQLKQELIREKHLFNKTVSLLNSSNNTSKNAQIPVKKSHQKKRRSFAVLNQDHQQMLLSLDKTCSEANTAIEQQFKQLHKQSESISKDQNLFCYCSDALAKLDTVDKMFLPQLFELQSLADAEEAHYEQKAVRHFKRDQKTGVASCETHYTT